MSTKRLRRPHIQHQSWKRKPPKKKSEERDSELKDVKKMKMPKDFPKECMCQTPWTYLWACPMGRFFLCKDLEHAIWVGNSKLGKRQAKPLTRANKNLIRTLHHGDAIARPSVGDKGCKIFHVGIFTKRNRVIHMAVDEGNTYIFFNESSPFKMKL